MIWREDVQEALRLAERLDAPLDGLRAMLALTAAERTFLAGFIRRAVNALQPLSRRGENVDRDRDVTLAYRSSPLKRGRAKAVGAIWGLSPGQVRVIGTRNRAWYRAVLREAGIDEIRAYVRLRALQLTHA